MDRILLLSLHTQKAFSPVADFYILQEKRQISEKHNFGHLLFCFQFDNISGGILICFEILFLLFCYFTFALMYLLSNRCLCMVVLLPGYVSLLILPCACLLSFPW